MTKEERKEYMRQWRELNRDRIKEKKLENKRRRALSDIKSVKPAKIDMIIVRTWNGGEYCVGRRRG